MPAAAEAAPPRPDGAVAEVPRSLRRAEGEPAVHFRARYRQIGAIIQDAMRQLPALDPSTDRVGRGVYLAIMQEIVDVLDDISRQLSISELSQLSHIAAEQWKAAVAASKADEAALQRGSRRRKEGGNVRADAAGGAGEDAVQFVGGSSNTRLPPAFSEIVQRIYGTVLTDDARVRGSQSGMPSS